MGDVSTFLELYMTGIALFNLVTVLWFVSPVFATNGRRKFCVIRRLFAGHNVFEAHRPMFSLHQVGWPHSRVSSLYIAATFFLF